MAAHDKSRIYTCELCPSGYKRVAKLISHVDREHGGEGSSLVAAEGDRPQTEELVGLLAEVMGEYAQRCHRGCGARFRSAFLKVMHEEKFCQQHHNKC